MKSLVEELEKRDIFIMKSDEDKNKLIMEKTELFSEIEKTKIEFNFIEQKY
jgi:hypothetical protein